MLSDNCYSMPMFQQTTQPLSTKAEIIAILQLSLPAKYWQINIYQKIWAKWLKSADLVVGEPCAISHQSNGKIRARLVNWSVFLWFLVSDQHTTCRRHRCKYGHTCVWTMSDRSPNSLTMQYTGPVKGWKSIYHVTHSYSSDQKLSAKCIIFRVKCL